MNKSHTGANQSSTNKEYYYQGQHPSASNRSHQNANAANKENAKIYSLLGSEQGQVVAESQSRKNLAKEHYQSHREFGRELTNTSSNGASVSSNVAALVAPKFSAQPSVSTSQNQSS